MKGNADVVRVLQDVLKAELTAINQYFVHAEMCENWGYMKLSQHTKKEAIAEMKHAEALIERILFLEATPNVSDYFKINIGDSVQKQLANDVALEYDAVKRLNEGIKVAVQHGDNGSRDLLQKILDEEEDHVDHLEAQLQMIQDMGIGLYLSQQGG